MAYSDEISDERLEEELGRGEVETTGRGEGKSSYSTSNCPTDANDVASFWLERDGDDWPETEVCDVKAPARRARYSFSDICSGSKTKDVIGRVGKLVQQVLPLSTACWNALSKMHMVIQSQPVKALIHMDTVEYLEIITHSKWV